MFKYVYNDEYYVDLVFNWLRLGDEHFFVTNENINKINLHEKYIKYKKGK